MKTKQNEKPKNWKLMSSWWDSHFPWKAKTLQAKKLASSTSWAYNLNTMVIQNFPGYRLCRIKPNLEPIKRTRTKACIRGENWREWHLGKNPTERCSRGLISLVGCCDVVSWFDDGKNPSQVFLHLINCNAFYRLMCRVHQSSADQGDLKEG